MDLVGEPVIMQDHDIILQSLNAPHNGIYFPVESFEGTEKAWETVPIIWAAMHPDLELVKTDLNKAVEQVMGKVLNASLKKVHIRNEGQPRLWGNLSLEKEREVEKYIREGKVRISTAGNVPIEDASHPQYFAKMNGKIEPNHILMFIEGANQPGDPGSGIMNTLKDKVKSLTNFVENLFGKPELDIPVPADPPAPVEPVPPTPEVPPEILKLRAELETALTKLEQMEKDRVTFQAKEKELDEVKNLLAGYVQKEKDVKWAEFKNICPPGFVHGDKEAETRARFETDPGSVSVEVVKFKESQKPAPAEGSGLAPAAVLNIEPEVYRGPRTQRWNAYTRQMEEI